MSLLQRFVEAPDPLKNRILNNENSHLRPTQSGGSCHLWRLLKKRRVWGERCSNDRWRGRRGGRSCLFDNWWRWEEWLRHLQQLGWWGGWGRRAAGLLLARLPGAEADLPQDAQEGLLLGLLLLLRLQVHLHLLCLKLVVQLKRAVVSKRAVCNNRPGFASAVFVSGLRDWF